MPAFPAAKTFQSFKEPLKMTIVTLASMIPNLICAAIGLPVLSLAITSYLLRS
jgi:maltodextrin utilization protein YvdJ